MKQKTKTVEFHKEIYTENVISAAIKDFSGITTVRYKNSDDYWSCIFINSRYDIEQTVKEFENYMIDLLNVRSNE